MTDAPVQRTTFRGFLFADLRGYSDFVERRGDHAGVELLTTYRQLVRSTVDRYEGAEIRTEGDSFFVVFPSASRAVSCAMEIVERASTAEPPIRVGVGIHAGEAADTGEGPVGSAVNIAARVCAQAGAGELLVTDMVRALTRTLVPYRFIPRGTPVLKGITEPMPLFRVAEPSSPDAEPAPTRPEGRSRQARRTIVAAIVAIAGVGAVAVIAAVGLSGSRPSPTPAPSVASAAPGTTTPVPTASPQPTAAPPTTVATASSAATPSPTSPVATPAPSPSSALTAAEADLVSRLAGLTPEERAACRPGTPQERADGATISVTCPLAVTDGATQAHFDLFDQQAVMLTAFGSYAGAHGDPTADCASAPLGGGAWDVPHVAQGHVLCFPQGTESRIIWIYEGGLGAGIMGTAQRPDSAWQQLYAWWQEFHPLIAH